jgi:ribosome recycling factor
MTAERRKELIKQVEKMGEESKVAVRNARRDADQSLKKLKGEISEDDIKRAEEALQKTTDKNTKEVDKVIKDKCDDLNVV